jgi:uncharacterized protein YacL
MGKSKPAAPRRPRERRSGRERRNNLHGADPARPGLQLLLARLISIFIGALVGFLAANVVSREYIAPLQVLVDEAQHTIDDANAQLTKIEPEYNRARQEYQRLAEDQTAGVGTTELPPAEDDVPPAGRDAAVDGVRSATDSESAATAEHGTEADGAPEMGESALPAAEVNEDELRAAARLHFETLRRQRQRLHEQTDFWENEQRNYRHDIDLLNLLGIVVVLVFTLLGYLLYPLTLGGLRRVSGHLEVFTAGLEHRVAQATVGFFAGLVIAMVIMLAIFNTFSADFSFLSLGWFRLLFGAFIVVVLGLSGSLVGVAYFGPPHQDDPFVELRKPSAPKILDTSVIIDGRIHEVSATGFLDGMLVVTNSVLRELQLLADSADERKRSKARRGLELVRKMQDDPRVVVRVYDDSSFDHQVQSTDEQLIVVAQAMNGIVVTNDYNLNRVAAIRNVRVINVNALANAVKTNHLPGDIIDIEIIDRGKQRGQGVGYLEDGTMVVVEDGEPYIGKLRTIKLTSVSQTVQGRLLFGRVDLVEEEQHTHG